MTLKVTRISIANRYLTLGFLDPESQLVFDITGVFIPEASEEVQKAVSELEALALDMGREALKAALVNGQADSLPL